MVDDIIESKILTGKTKEEIILLLGNDFKKGPCESCIGYSINDPTIGFSIDHDVLAIYFDTLDEVVEVKIDMW